MLSKCFLSLFYVLKNALLRCLRAAIAKSLIQHYMRCLLDSFATYLLDLQIQHVLGVSKTSCRDVFSVFIRHLQDIFNMSLCWLGSKCLNLTPCVTNRNHLSKYNLIFFFFKFTTGFFSSEGALRKELLYERTRTRADSRKTLII